MAIPKSEINAVIAAMTNPELSEDATNEEVAIAVITALSSVRDLTKRFLAVSQQRLHSTDDWSTFAVGPFTTENQAATAGEGMSGRPKQPGYGHWKVAVLVPSASESWKILTKEFEEKPDRFGWVGEYKRGLDPSKWTEHEGRGSW